jgi:hypothetical protein
MRRFRNRFDRHTEFLDGIVQIGERLSAVGETVSARRGHDRCSALGRAHAGPSAANRSTPPWNSHLEGSLGVDIVEG